MSRTQRPPRSSQPVTGSKRGQIVGKEWHHGPDVLLTNQVLRQPSGEAIRPPRHKRRVWGEVEPHRITRRLDPLGGLSDDRSATTGEVSRRAARASGPNGVRGDRRAWFAVGG